MGTNRRFPAIFVVPAAFLLSLIHSLSSPVLAYALGGVSPVGAEFQVNVHTTSHQRGGKAVALPAGGFVTVWSGYDNQDGHQWGVFARRHTSTGAFVGSPFQVNTYIQNQQGWNLRNVDVDGDSDGNFVVTWRSGWDQDGQRNGVFAQRYDSSANAVGAEFQVNTITAWDQMTPTVAVDAGGPFRIVWRGNDGSGLGLAAQLYDAAGATVGAEHSVTGYLTGTQLVPEAAARSDGGYVLVWGDAARDGNDYGAFGRLFDQDGAPVAASFMVNSYTTGKQQYPRVAVGPDDGFVVAWKSRDQAVAGSDVYAQRYDSDGAEVGGEFLVNTHTAGTQGNVDLAIDPLGNVLFVWAGEGPGDSIGVFAREFDADGTAAGPEFLVNAYTTDAQAEATVTALGAGNFVVLWESAGQDGDALGQFGRKVEVICGNGVVGAGEDCDDGVNNGTGDGFCLDDCSGVQDCGDGDTEGTEVCDDGTDNGTGDGYCLDDCSDVQDCGDGDTEGTEDCDDVVESATCDADCTDVKCGDSTVNETAGEDCDDGVESDTCDANCTDVVCGDGTVNATAGEECDDDGTATDDGCDDVCAVETCYACTGEPSDCAPDTGAGCDDGDPCTVNDQCSAQAVCAGGDKDCSGAGDQCNLGLCNAGTGACEPDALPNGTGCDDTLFCTDVDECSGGVCAGAGDPCTQGDQCSDACNEAADDCFDDAGTPCDDANTCTVDDQCDGAGFCGATDTLFGSACEWFGLTASSGTAKLKQKRHVTIVGGGLCADRMQIGLNNNVDGDIVATEATDDRAVRIYPMVVVTGDVATGGGGVVGGGGARLPHLTPAITALAGGETLAKDDPPGGVYDTTGGSTLVANCMQSQTEAIAAAATIAGLASDLNMGRVELDPRETLNVVAPNPGGLNVIDFERLTGAADVTINVDGGGDPDTIVILRIDRKLQVKARSAINLVNGLDPANFVAFVTGKKLWIGNKSTVAGTLYAAGFVKIDSSSTVDGQIFAAGKKLQIGERVMGTTVPNQIVLP